MIPLDSLGECGATNERQDDARVLYSRLPKAVEEAFVCNPRVELDDLFVVLHEVPNAPLGIYCGGAPLDFQRRRTRILVSASSIHQPDEYC